MILITGAAGFIGSVLLKELNRLGHKEIVVVDRLRDTKKWLNFRSAKFSQYIHADELFKEGTPSWFSELEAIYHIGACSATIEMNMDYLMRNNVEYSKRIFEEAENFDIPIVYASSAATYGDGELGYSDNHEKVPTFRPLNPYGYSKQLFDEWVLERLEPPRVWFGLKYFNVYGPNEYHKGEQRSIVHKAFEQIQATGQVKLFKSHRDDFDAGEQLRDFIYVKDVVSAMIQMIEGKDHKRSGIYNMGTGRARSFNDLVHATYAALDVPKNIEYVDMPLNIRNQYQYYTQADMSKFQELLPDFKFTSLEDGVRDYVVNYLSKGQLHY